METKEKRSEQTEIASPARGLDRRMRGPLGMLTLIAFLGYGIMYFVVFFYALLVGKAFIPPILVEAMLVVIAAGVIATRWRWAAYVGAVVALLTLYDPIFQPHDIYVFMHPGQSNYEFSLILSVIAFGLVALIACVGTIIRNYRGQGLESSLPRFSGIALSGYAGIAIGMILLSLVVTIVPQTGVDSTSTNSQPTVHMTLNRFAPEVVLVPKGAKLLITNDKAVEHILQNGVWDASGSSHPVVEPGAPTLGNVDITGGSAEIGPFTTAGTYHIYCTVHRGMNLTIVVQ